MGLETGSGVVVVVVAAVVDKHLVFRGPLPTIVGGCGFASFIIQCCPLALWVQFSLCVQVHGSVLLCVGVNIDIFVAYGRLFFVQVATSETQRSTWSTKPSKNVSLSSGGTMSTCSTGRSRWLPAFAMYFAHFF